jgi:hypothetical protein
VSAWSDLASGRPAVVLIPGDPSGAYRLADQLTGLAEVTADAARALSRVEVDWTGGAGTAFVETFALQPRVLKDAAAAFDAGAAALTRYAVDLIAARGEAQVAIDWWRQGLAEAHAAQDASTDSRTSFAARTWQPCTPTPGLATQRAAASKLDNAYAALDRAGHAAADALVAAQAHAPAAATWWETAAPTAYGLTRLGDTPTKREFALGAGRGVIDLFLTSGDRRAFTLVNEKIDAWSKGHGLNPDSAATGWGKLAGAMLIPIPGEGALAGVSATVLASLTRKAANATLKTVLNGLDKTPNLIARRTITPDAPVTAILKDRVMAKSAEVSARRSETLVFDIRSAAREGLPGELIGAGNRFFRGATLKSQDFAAIGLPDGGYRLQFFSPANTPGYGKLYVQEVDNIGQVLREYKQTMGPEGLIETKWVHGGP